MSLLLAGLCLAQLAAPSPETAYEDRLVDWALATTGRVREPAPEGKAVEEVLFATENVFAATDPIPTELNVFHVRTREKVLASEVMLAVGAPWDAERAQETERNLRRLYILAVAKVLAVQGRAGGVAVLVVTKDRWSLRLNSEFTLIGSLLQLLRLRPTEMNFLGHNQQLALDFALRLDTLTAGQTFIERRFLGHDLYLGETAALVFNRQSGALEGSNGVAAFGKPLYSLQQTLGAVGSVQWDVARHRQFQGARVLQLPTPDGATVPWEYDVRTVDAELEGTRSFGQTWKTNLSAALQASSHRYAPPPEVGADTAGAQVLRDGYLPRSEDVTAVAANVLFYRAEYRALHDLEAYQLSEDWQVGPRLYAAVRWAVPTPLAASSFVEVAAAARWRFARWDNLLSLAAAASTRLRFGDTPVNNRLVVELREFSPSFQGGRLVWRLIGDFIADDLTRRTLALGGSNGLRGAWPEEHRGRNRVISNLEWRLKPFEVLSQWLAFVAFYDAGTAFDDAPAPTHTLGFGLRLLLPHFNDEVIRVDFGIVIGGAVPGLDRLNASYGQVTELRPTFLDTPL